MSDEKKGKGKNQHIVKRAEGWAVRGEGNTKDTVVRKTKAEVTELGKTIAKNQKSELVIHGRDGKIQEKNTYGKDPFPPKG